MLYVARHLRRSRDDQAVNEAVVTQECGPPRIPLRHERESTRSGPAGVACAVVAANAHAATERAAHRCALGLLCALGIE